MSFLSTVGKDFKAVFAWLGSPKGQAVVQTGEVVVEDVATAFGFGNVVQGGINLLNKWAGEAIKVETLAAAAGQQTGSGATKSSAVLSVMVPELAAYLQAQGITSSDVTSQANAINTALINLLNTLASPNTAKVPVTTVATPAPAMPVS